MASVKFDNALQPLFTVCKISGVISFQVSKNNYKKSKLGVVYNLFLTCTYLSAYLYSLYSDWNKERLDILLRTIVVLQSLSGLVTVLVAWATSMIHQNDYIQVIDKIKEIDKSFRELGVWIYYEKLRSVTSYYIIGKCAFVLFTFIITASRIADFTWNAILEVLVYNVPILMYALICLLAMVFLKIIKERFIILNQHLKELQRYEVACTIQSELKKFKLTSPLGTKLSLLRMICPLHHELCKVIIFFNDIFGVVLLIIFGNSFVIITTNMYYFITKLKQFSLANLYEVCSIIGFFILCICDTLTLCSICHSTIEEAEESGILLHKIDYENQEIKNQIEMFSLQIAHENLEFSAAGFFPINFTLLYSIVGGVTTYLVILMQLSGGS